MLILKVVLVQTSKVYLGQGRECFYIGSYVMTI
jgi:hypothetical protein